jgi:transcriptional regulator with GAF, ATPase, and Fis domain
VKVTWLIVLISWTVSVAATPTKQVELFIDAYNKHDIEKMLERISEEVKWFYDINDKLLLETDGKDLLRKAVVTHLNRQTHASSQIKQSLTHGDTVAIIEEASPNDGERSQCAFFIYQMETKPNLSNHLLCS